MVIVHVSVGKGLRSVEVQKGWKWMIYLGWNFPKISLFLMLFSTELFHLFLSKVAFKKECHPKMFHKSLHFHWVRFHENEQTNNKCIRKISKILKLPSNCRAMNEQIVNSLCAGHHYLYPKVLVKACLFELWFNNPYQPGNHFTFPSLRCEGNHQLLDFDASTHTYYCLVYSEDVIKWINM